MSIFSRNRIVLLVAITASFQHLVAEPCKGLEFASGSLLVYPPIALAANISGSAKVVLHVDGKGGIVSVDIVSSPSKLLEGGTKLNANSLKLFWPVNWSSGPCEQAVDFRYQVLPDTADSGYLRVTFDGGAHIVIEAKRHPPTVNY
jgi:hypothetical protein